MEMFPFVAVVGQERIKNALIWNMVNPAIGGLLVSGEKGTAKSTLIRGINSLAGSRYIEELPLNADENSLHDVLDFEQMVCTGKGKMRQGLFTRAEGKFLYIDEVNLLSDHIVNDLIEATGEDRKIALIGTMNPEEGPLRPQLLDRFGLYAEAEGEKDLRLRGVILKRRMQFDDDQSAFAKQWSRETEKLWGSIQKARQRLKRVTVTENATRLAVELAAQGGCDSIRAELTLIETAKAIAAFDGRSNINAGDLQQAALYALPHRMKPSGEKNESHKTPEERQSGAQSNDEVKPAPEAAEKTEKEPLEEQEHKADTEEIENKTERNAPEDKMGQTQDRHTKEEKEAALHGDTRMQVDLPEELFSWENGSLTAIKNICTKGAEDAVR